jgi:hypothetical protein
VGGSGGLNIWLDMPFRTNARWTITNELDKAVPLFYQIDYTLEDSLAANIAHLHVLFRRENPTRQGRDFELLPRRVGAGCLIGVVMGVRPLQPQWWGEGEVKMYLDGDQDFPTIVGTGAEDYVGLSWGLQQNAFLYNGASWLERGDGIDTGRVSMYRWHLRDPIIWREEARVTVQQIGHQPDAQPPKDIAEYQAQLYERADDWCVTTFWYQVAGQPLPVMPSLVERLADIQPK